MTDLATIRIPVDNSEVTQAISLTRKLENNVIRLEKSLRSGKITSGQYNAELGRQAKNLTALGVSYNKANSEVRKFAASIRHLEDRELNNLGRGFQDSQKAARRFELGVQQAGFQIGDFAVQVASGTNPLVAFAQQATQLAGFFAGKWGAVIGAGIAIASGLGIALMGIRDAARQAKEEASDLTDVLSSLEDATDRLNLSVEESIEKYGAAAGVVREFSIAQAESALAQAQQRLNDQILLLDETTSVYTEATNAVNDFGEALDYSDVLRKISKDFKVSAQDAFRLFDAFSAIQDASDFEGQRSALLEVDRILRDAGVSAGQLPPELNRALFELRDLVFQADQLAAAMDRAKSAARNMTFGRVDALFGLTGEQLLPPGPEDDTDKPSRGSAPRETVQEYLAQLEKEAEFKRSLVGLTQEESTVKQRLFEITEAALEKEGTLGEVEMARINALVELEAKTRQLTLEEQRRAQLQQGINKSIENSLMALVDGTKSVEDAFKGMLRNIILDIYRQKVLEPIGGSIGGALTKFLGLASGGSMMPNQPYLVGERGPEIVVPRHSGTVVNANQTANALSGGGNITVQNNINVTGGSDPMAIRQEVVKLMPQITEATKTAVIDARRRGGQMKSAFS